VCHLLPTSCVKLSLHGLGDSLFDLVGIKAVFVTLCYSFLASRQAVQAHAARGV